jgi:transcription elongation factor Elf1
MDKKMANKKCPKCKKIHLTEVDKMGVAYNIICDSCKEKRNINVVTGRGVLKGSTSL